MNETHTDRPIRPGATLDWEWDWTDWMRPGDSISTREIAATDKISAGVPALTGAVVTALLTCASDAPIGSRQRAVCTIQTAAGRTDRRSIRFVVVAA